MSSKHRIETDVAKLMMTDYKVSLINDSIMEFCVDFHGPKDSPYEHGFWKVRCVLPDGYPFKSPSIGFVNKIFHPNIDEQSGSVCLDVINQAWSPMFAFLPQLLMYPNPTDPLNGEAAALLMRQPDQYNVKVKEYVEKFATEKAMLQAVQESQNPSQRIVVTSSESEMSDSSLLSDTQFEDDI